MSRSSRRIGREAAEVCERISFSYVPKADGEMRRRYTWMPEVTPGATLQHLMRGSIDDRTIEVFQSTYIIAAGSTIIPVTSTIYAAAAPDWPRVDVVPRSFIARLAWSMGIRPGLRLDDDTFNRRFQVKTPDENFGITLLSPGMQQFMVEKPSVKWRLTRGLACLVYAGGLKPTRLEQSLDRVGRFWSLVEPELLQWV